MPATPRLAVFYLSHPDEDPIVRLGWKFASDASYGSIVYGKTATVLTTLEAVLGEATLRQALTRLLHCATALPIPPEPIFSIPLKRYPAAKIWSPTLPRLSTAPRCSTTPWTLSPPAPASGGKATCRGPIPHQCRGAPQRHLPLPGETRSRVRRRFEGASHLGRQDRWTRFSWDKPRGRFMPRWIRTGMSCWTLIRSIIVTPCNRPHGAFEIDQLLGLRPAAAGAMVIVPGLRLP
jgi:hypothetical protein